MTDKQVLSSTMKEEFRVLVLTAMSNEYALVLPWLEQPHVLSSFNTTAHLGNVGNAECLTVMTGIGKVNAAVRAYQAQLQFQPNLILNVGVCGALQPDLPVGTTVLSSAFTYHDVWCGEGNSYGQVQGGPAIYEVEPAILSAFANVAPDLRRGLFCSGDFFMPNQTYLDQLLKHFPDAMAIDMESTAIAQVAYMTHTPCIAMRIISDTPRLSIDLTKQYAKFWDAPESAFENLYSLLRSFLAAFMND
jgi:MTA/SAH nucleosidase